MKKMNGNFEHNVEPTIDELGAMEEELKNEEITEPSADELMKCDGIQIYLNEAKKIPLLTAAEELALGKLIKDGGSEAAAAKERLIKSNLLLVMHYARKYVGRGVELDDLNTMGIEGLIMAVDRFDYSKGFRFSTYASWWIIQSINRGISDEGSTIRIPSHMCENINKIKRARRDFVQKNGCEPTVNELSEITGLAENKVKTALESLYTMVSFDAKVSEDSDTTLEEFIVDENAENPCDIVVKGDLRSVIEESLTRLNEKEALVIRLRYGIGYDTPMTLEQIAGLPEFRVTRERIRQIEAKALRKIAHSPSIRNLRDYVA